MAEAGRKTLPDCHLGRRYERSGDLRSTRTLWIQTRNRLNMGARLRLNRVRAVSAPSSADPHRSNGEAPIIGAAMVWLCSWAVGSCSPDAPQFNCNRLRRQVAPLLPIRAVHKLPGAVCLRAKPRSGQETVHGKRKGIIQMLRVHWGVCRR